MFDPERVTALHDWHLQAGAVFEDVGQWKRPRYYPQDGEDMDAAVLRECAATRTGVGILDGSTLGKIDVQGPDSATFLDLIYTNLMSSLKVGAVRYGVMCGVDGMVIDDGTVLRLADEQFLVLTTTGGAARILDWMEEWLQTEWPHLRVYCTSVTEQWVTFPVVGPRSRDVIGAVFPGVDVANESFPFMAIRDTTLDGVPVRLARISFSGELAFEVYVNPWYAVDVWQRLLDAGAPTGSPPTARKPCTSCARRRVTRSSARTPTAPSAPTTSVWRGRCRRRRSISSGNVPSPGPPTLTRRANTWWDCSRWIGALCYRRARRSSSSSRTANCRHHRYRCSAT